MCVAIFVLNQHLRQPGVSMRSVAVRNLTISEQLKHIIVLHLRRKRCKRPACLL